MDQCAWKSLVHSSYWDSVTCHDLQDDGCTVFVSSKEGSFLEFHKRVIERSCRTNYCSVESIEQFFTYHPYKRYFLLRELDKLIIITEAFEIFQVHNGVRKYEIGDFTGEGRPQVRLWLLGDGKEPFILDFSLTHATNSVVANQSEDFLSNRLQLKLKETKEIVTKFIQEMEGKRHLRAETLQRLAANCPCEPCPPPTGLQHFFGVGTEENFHQTSGDVLPLQILHRWQKTVSDKWILGMALKNSSNRSVHNLKVFLDESSEKRICYIVRRLNSTNMNKVFTRFELKTPQVFASPAVTWQEERVNLEIPPGKGCILTVVLPFPEFIWSSKKCITGRMSYSQGFLNEISDSYSQEFPSFEATAGSVLDESLLPQDCHKHFLHAVSVISVCEKITLTVSSGIVPSRTLEDLLTTGIGFSQPSSDDNFFLHPGLKNAALGGCMVQLIHMSEGYEIKLYARSREMLRLLVYSIVEASPGSWSISCGPAKPNVISHSSSVTLGDCADGLSKEIHGIIYNLSRWKKNVSSHTLSTDLKSYVNFRREILDLQRKTDAIFSSFEHESNKSGHIIFH